MNLRPYQQAAVDAVYEHLQTKDTNPCVVLPPGCGKSVILGKLAADVVSLWGGRVLVLAHVKELLEQNAGKIRHLCPDLPVGVYSAGLKSRDTKEKIIVAGIQSVYNKACQLDAFDLIIVDEAHLVAPAGEGMYRTFLNDMKIINPKLRVVGLTATPYRLQGGLICKPENILNEVCYEAGLKEMIAQGYLSPIVSRAGKAEANLSAVHTRGGEFVADELESAMNTEELVRAACREIAELTGDRKSVLIFTTGVAHCRHVAETITAFTGEECAVVTGDTPGAERAEILARFKGESVRADLFGNVKLPLKFVANVSVLTTGFDAPNTDCVVMLRPTQSPGLLVQCAGRGLRLSPETGKTNCIFLDYGGNILRHGPLDMITVKEKSSGTGEAPAKKCPGCNALIHAAFARCPECGYEFPPPEKTNLSGHAAHAGVLSGEILYDDYPVQKVYYSVHEKRFAAPGTPKTLQVDYETAYAQYQSEWLCPEHTGYARERFVKWWKERAAPGAAVPKTAAEAVEAGMTGLLAEPTQITVRTVSGEKYRRICKYRLGARPVLPEPGEDRSENPPDPPPGLFPDGEIPF